ncbi:hypothetical protein D9613_012388 [Agrocybe pediades]|uniref:Uncharacterized protein n=1 Tax=Agrocybe pediades TaxID=84607 RepID=A0A8H4VQ10_9AGAR|nr:hypothetical protein D9613_012388 [Agrocybe pediades]KAF9550761.1 hypothetical protein CPC08DRAFT_755122 [Agrocybe pediades]
MRFSLNVVAVAALFLSSTALAAFEHDIDAIVARHALDEELAARGEVTELELRAMLVERTPNGDCSTPFPEKLGGTACYKNRGHGWKLNGQCLGKTQMMLRGDSIKAYCYF